MTSFSIPGASLRAQDRPAPATGRRRLLRLAAREWPSLAAAVLGLAAVGAAQLSLTWLVKLWLEDLLADQPALTPSAYLSFALALIAVLLLGVFTSCYALRRFEQRILRRLRDQTAARLLQVPAAGVRRDAAGDLMSRVMHDALKVAALPPSVVRRMTDGLVVAGGAIVLMLVLDFRLAAIAAAAALPVAWLLDRFQRAIRKASQSAHRAVGELSALLGEQLAGATTVRLFGAREFERQRFARRNRRATRRLLVTELWATGLITVVWALAALGVLAAVWYGSGRVASGALSTGGLLAFCLYGGQIVEPLRRLGDLQAEIHWVSGPLSRLFEIWDRPPEAGGGRRLDGTGPAALSLVGLGFAYRPELPVLAQVDLEVAPGETVGVVAASGGGKSTLAALLGRLIDPDAGSILLDGHELRTLELDALRRSVVVVEQESFLFAATLRENLVYGSWDAGAEQVREAVALAGLDRWLATLPRGLDTDVSEAGRSLSGGQRQRLALARAILRQPRLLVLDEATSALDGETEALIFERMASWLSRRTVIVMAHRLSTVARLARVVAFAGGRIVADGSPRELLRSSSAFRELFRDQAEALAPTA